jgi:hypothetical protein
MQKSFPVKQTEGKAFPYIHPSYLLFLLAAVFCFTSFVQTFISSQPLSLLIDFNHPILIYLCRNVAI